MAMFRKKPVTVEAHQVPDPSDLQAWGELAGWLLRHDCQALLDGPDGEVGVDALLIPTLEGTMRADVGDWIIRGVQGEFYPCKSDIFEATYERVADDERTNQVSEVRGDEAP